MDIPNYLLYVQRCIQISQGLLIDVPDHLLYFLHMHHRERKARGSRSMLHIVSITFSTYITVYKKQGTP
jgi:heme/copper-type cytochrome/quinol oxidase subunit 4